MRIHHVEVTRSERHDKCRGKNDRVTRDVQHEATPRLYARIAVTPVSKDSPKGSVHSAFPPFLHLRLCGLSPFSQEKGCRDSR